MRQGSSSLKTTHGSDYVAGIIKRLPPEFWAHPDWPIVAVNNGSFHACAALAAQEETLKVRPLLMLNSLLYHDPGDFWLVCSEVEYGRTLVDAARRIPVERAARAHPIALLLNDSSEARRERASASRALADRFGGNAPPCVLQFFENPVSCLAFDGDGFHDSIAGLRDAVRARLNRPFNIDATLLNLDVSGPPLDRSLIAALEQLGLLVTTEDSGQRRLTVLPCCHDLARRLYTTLEPAVLVRGLFHKVRLYQRGTCAQLLLAPMVHADLEFQGGSEERLLGGSDSRLLSSLLLDFRRCVQAAAESDVRRLALYDILGFWADLELGRALLRVLRAAGISASCSLDRPSTEAWYGPRLSDLFDEAVSLDVATAGERVLICAADSTVEPNPMRSDPATLTLVKTVIVREYESQDATGLPKTLLERRGLSFQEIVERTGLNSLDVSIAIDRLSDLGLTESFNRLLPLGSKFRINRAYNSLSDEFMSVLALILWIFHGSDRPNEEPLPTPRTTLNKILAVVGYLGGLRKCQVTFNWQGKTITVHDEPDKAVDGLTIDAILAEGREFFAVSGDDVTLTEAAKKRDWTTHLPAAGRVRRQIEMTAAIWKNLDGSLRLAKANDQGPRGRYTSEIFYAFVDSIGNSSPEWGSASIAHQLEWGLIHHKRENSKLAQASVGDAWHKLRVLRDAQPFLARIQADLFRERGFDRLSRNLLQRYGVLPHSSLMLQLLERVVQTTKQAVDEPYNPVTDATIRSWTSLFKPLGDGQPRRRTQPRLPVSGYIALVDVLGTCQMAELRIDWALEVGVQAAAAWAKRYGALVSHPVIDGLVCVFGSFEDAVRFAVGAHTHVGELYAELQRLSRIETCLLTGLVQGGLREYQSPAGREITGASVALAHGLQRNSREINLHPDLVSGHAEQLRALGLVDWIEQGANGLPHLCAHGAFEVLFLRAGKEALAGSAREPSR